MTKTTLYLNEGLLQEAMLYAGTQKKTRVVETALQEYVRQQRVLRFVDDLGTYDMDGAAEVLARRDLETNAI